jgi:hypothetical protein
MTGHIGRREFITLIGGAAVVWPLATRAQQQPKMLRVGFVGMQPREFPIYTSFLKRMAELGYQEGRNFTFPEEARMLANQMNDAEAKVRASARTH